MSELEKGLKIKDRYLLLEKKGDGGFGKVWLAHDEFIDEKVAIKFYVSLSEDGIKEFKDEFKTAYGLKHDFLLNTSYYDIWERRPFLVMDYCPNGSTAKMAGNTTEKVLWQFIHDVASGLACLHEQKPDPIVHQDIKPENILINKYDNFIITDFGISMKIRTTMRKQSDRNTSAGTIAYMAPERFSQNPTPIKASDIWSLGATVYDLATGGPPFCGLGGGMLNKGAEIPVLPQKWSKDLNEVMQACMSKEAWERPTAEQLSQYASDILKGIRPKKTWQNKIEHKKPSIIWIGAISVILLITGIFFFVKREPIPKPDLLTDAIVNENIGELIKFAEMDSIRAFSPMAVHYFNTKDTINAVKYAQKAIDSNTGTEAVNDLLNEIKRSRVDKYLSRVNMISEDTKSFNNVDSLVIARDCYSQAYNNAKKYGFEIEPNEKLSAQIETVFNKWVVAGDENPILSVKKNCYETALKLKNSDEVRGKIEKLK